MFGQKRKKITDLTATNKKLTDRLAEVDSDPYYLIAQQLRAGVETAFNSGDSDAQQYLDEAVAQKRAELIKERAAKLARVTIAGQTREQKADLEKEAQIEANRLAAAALARFMDEEAPEYRQKVQARLAAERPRAVIQAAKLQIERELYEEQVAEAAKELRSEKVEKERLKKRAKQLRETTQHNHILSLSQLQTGDLLTLCFVDKGRGHSPLTDAGTYYSELERRQISGQILDTETGVFEIEKDSWLGRSRFDPFALRGGQQVRFLAEDPSMEQRGLLPHFVKGMPLTFQTLGGATLPGTDKLDIWWINLGEYRVLS